MSSAYFPVREQIKPIAWRDRKCVSVTVSEFDMYGAPIFRAEWEGDELQESYWQQLAKVGVPENSLSL